VRQPLTSVHAQVCRHLAEQTADLEAAAHPALDALTRRVMTTTLERVRRVKTRLVRLKTRVETVRLLRDAVQPSTVRAVNVSLVACGCKAIMQGCCSCPH
jgi:hypothetical protein